MVEEGVPVVEHIVVTVSVVHPASIITRSLKTYLQSLLTPTTHQNVFSVVKFRNGF